MANLALALLLYPGLALVLVLTLVFGWLTEGRVHVGWLRGTVWGSFDALSGLASVVLAALALALLPWPLHLDAGWPLVGSPIAIGAALEGAFLLPVLPGLLATSPLGQRAAIREAQMSVAGRCVVWLALGAALWAGAGWAASAIPGRALVALAGLLALPAAIGAGPFGAERSLNAAGAEEGLDEATAALVRFARTARGAALLAALIVASVPPGLIQPWIALLLIGGLFVVIVLLLNRVAGMLPRLTLPAALRWCWWRALPLALVGLVYLIFI
ncbi:MAG TPA: hypothetical protein VKE41_09350 [Roseiflexaceae bacterium]|nr:hypothetical protein [Roseiflexaceae bacterium]